MQMGAQLQIAATQQAADSASVEVHLRTVDLLRVKARSSPGIKASSRGVAVPEPVPMPGADVEEMLDIECKLCNNGRICVPSSRDRNKLPKLTRQDCPDNFLLSCETNAFELEQDKDDFPGHGGCRAFS